MNTAQVLEAIDGMKPAMKQAYLNQIAATLDAVTLAEVQQAIDDQDSDKLAIILFLGSFSALVELFRVAYVKGGAGELATLKVPGVKLSKEFDAMSKGAHDFLKGQSDGLLGTVSTDQRNAIQQILEAATARGQSSAKTALDLIGRVSKQTGKRTGGVLGLSGNLTSFVTAAKDQLLSGDPEQMKAYLTRTRRDPAFDKAIREAINTGKRIKVDDIDRIVGAYADRLLEMQAETLAETYAGQSLNEGRDQAVRQAIDGAAAKASPVALVAMKRWDSRRDGRVRNTHRAMNGQTVAMDAPFTSPSGAMLMFPLDTSLGAPLRERARCRCVVTYQLAAAPLSF